MNRWSRRTAAFTLGLACSGLGALACVLNPQPLPPDQPDGALSAVPAVADGGSRDGAHGDSAKGPGQDSGPVNQPPEAGSTLDVEVDAPTDATPDGWQPDAAYDAHDDA
jgi:hypothetical protein